MIKTRPIFLLILLLISVASAKPNDPYQLIDKQPQAEALMREVLSTMQSRFNLRLTRQVEMHLVEAAVMDKMISQSPYKGAQVGLYTGVKNGKHQVYVMKGWGRDQCAGIVAHELTHAWQQENAPYDQDLVLKEGFAMWVEYKYFDVTGAFAYAQRIRETADPVYGVGFFAVIETEDAVGANQVAEVMRKAVKVSDLPKGKKKP